MTDFVVGVVGVWLLFMIIYIFAAAQPIHFVVDGVPHTFQWGLHEVRSGEK